MKIPVGLQYFGAGSLFVFALMNVRAILHGATLPEPTFSYRTDLIVDLVFMVLLLIPNAVVRRKLGVLDRSSEEKADG